MLKVDSEQKKTFPESTTWEEEKQSSAKQIEKEIADLKRRIAAEMARQQQMKEGETAIPEEKKIDAKTDTTFEEKKTDVTQTDTTLEEKKTDSTPEYTTADKDTGSETEVDKNEHCQSDFSYVVDQMIDVVNDKTNEVIYCKDVRHLPQKHIDHVVCSFLNNEEGGTIWFGVWNKCTIGTKIDRVAQDEFCLAIDNTFQRMKPMPQHYKVVFHKMKQNEKDEEYVPNLYVIELRIEKQIGSRVLYDVCLNQKNDGRVFFRDQEKTTQSTPRDIKQKAFEKKEKECVDEIEYLKRVLDIQD